MYKGRGEPAAVYRSARVARIDLLVAGALPDEIHADLEIRDQHRIRALEDGEGVADMVVMAVSQQNVRHAIRDRVDVLFRAGIAAQERIDQDFCTACLDGERGMAMPGQLHHAYSSPSGRRQDRTPDAVVKTPSPRRPELATA